ncbi:MAG: hypothetical protein J6O61_16440 [Butyrivibrio sp.]|uniref:hypothetical protein n=1 Tax=Butyrivibrio sp. TaxID=28121 RepID=UPI001B14C2F2|nr:hypothetical protein [Butyrivibrio sp.]MBO6242393.1 hypothetical protein [Butyrivibrio sp.]
MGIIKLDKGQFLHKTEKETVKTIEIVVKGSIQISNAYSSILCGVGGFIGIVENPGTPYIYDYQAVEETTVYSYDFNSRDDIPKIIKSNPKIAPILAAQSSEIAAGVCAAYEKQFDDALAEYEQIMADHADYPSLCIKVGEVAGTFPEIDELIPPEKSEKVPSWVIDFSNSLKENEAVLKKSFYGLNIELATGMIMTTVTMYKTISDQVLLLNEYRKVLKKKTSSFASTMKVIKAKIADMERNEGGDGNVTIVNALNTILVYSGVSGEKASKFEEQISAFKANSNRYDSSDEARTLRRNIATSFYEVFTPAFLRSLTDDNVPIEVKMFFMFGFVDEELAGEKNTAILYNMAKAYVPDENKTVLTLYEWLKKIFMLEVEPSKNEFDQDWPTYLREQKTTGSITQAQLEAMQDNPQKRLEFEIHNLFALGNRMTFGRISSFVPVFDEQNVLRPLDMAYQTASKVNGYFDMIRGIDYGVFCRQALYSNTDIGITQVFFDDDITPYMILMPNIGSRACLWQEIDGKNRRTKARMLVSILNTENTEEAMIKLFGEFRWEMCKTEQGVHWNDVTDPSLTSMYCDYLQFYKKNSALSAENKEKLKTDLKKFNNNYKNVFISDYLSYVKFEASGSPRLNKVTREILFTFCPFSKAVREKNADNPQYKDLFNHYQVRTNNAAKPILNIIAKLNKEGIPVPEELTNQIEHLKK